MSQDLFVVIICMSTTLVFAILAFYAARHGLWFFMEYFVSGSGNASMLISAIVLLMIAAVIGYVGMAISHGGPFDRLFATPEDQAMIFWPGAFETGIIGFVLLMRHGSHSKPGQFLGLGKPSFVSDENLPAPSVEKGINIIV